MSTPERFDGDPTGSRLDDAVLAAVFSQSPIGLQLMDTHLRIVRVNSAARLIRQFPVDRMLGRPLLEVLRAFEVDRAEQIVGLARRVLETGQPVLDLQIHLRSKDDPPVEAVASAACFRLQDTDGTVLGLATALVDITDRTRAEARLLLLNTASTTIGTTLDVFRTAAELCEVTVPQLADSVAVDVLDSVMCGEAPTSGAVTGNLPLRRAGFRSGAPDVHQGVPSVGEVSVYRVGTPYRQVLSTLQPRLIQQVDPDSAWLDLDRTRGARLRAAGVHSLMVVPMCARGVVLGLACFYRWRDPSPFDREDLALAEQLAASTALCLDNARLYNRERSVARILQLSLRPPPPAVHIAAETAHDYLPAGSGGGWFDVIPLSGARVALALGATTGQDRYAAAAMGELRAAIAALSDLDLPPDEILERVHDLVTGPARAADQERRPDQSQPATCLYTVYDPVTRACTTARAGHPPPAVLLPDGTAEFLDVPEGPPLGEGLAHYTVGERTLPEGSVLVLHNDALLQEGPRPLHLPLDRVSRAAATAESSLQDACDAILDAVAPEQPGQDVVLLLARTRALDADQTAAWSLPNRPEAVARARKLTAAQLATWGLADLEDLTDSTALIVSELVTNAVRYAEGPIELRLIRDRTLICEVTDDSSTAPHLRRAHDSDEGGRGLYITAQLTERWGTRPGCRGKTIWAEQLLPDPTPANTSGGSAKS
ncbi:anti-sigma regulatory factor (Ser/Thr protein kinase) [Streptacidiphilus sp. MAP12-16]|uniref:SpoIIE family protein phosphatase n=1 Tax=Streptacidiphilus sp. MAP12-16 TaxID=3156300 RepID=UPI0035191040